MAAPVLTAERLITGALKDLNVVGAGITLDPNDLVDGFDKLRDMMDAFAIESLMIFHTPRTVYPLTANVESYTIGIGGDFNQHRPQWIPFAGVILNNTTTPPVELPIPVLSVQQWAQTGMKSLQTNVVQRIYYNYAWSNEMGRIYVNPIPTVGTISLALYVPEQLLQFADLHTEYTFPPGYARALRALLAIELAPMHGASISPELGKIAIDAKTMIQRANVRPRRLLIDRAMLRTTNMNYSSYNIYGDTNVPGGGPRQY